MRFILALLLLAGLSGCAGSVSELLGHTTAGSALVTSTHVPGAQCPDFTGQGSVNVSDFVVSCSTNKDGTYSETLTVKSVDPIAALKLGVEAQNAALTAATDVLKTIIPLLEKAAAASVGIPPGLVP